MGSRPECYGARPIAERVGVAPDAGGVRCVRAPFARVQLRQAVNYLKVSTFHTPGARHALASVTRNIIGANDDPWYLDRIGARTLLVWGEDDRVLDLRSAAVFERRIAESSLETLPDCGHLPHVEVPEITAAILARFLDGLARS